MQKVVFESADRAFHQELHRRVDAYFADRGISRKANAFMIAKGVYFSVVLALLWSALVFFTPHNAVFALLLCLLAGAHMAFFGFNVGHDAIHGAYSDRPWVNKLLSGTFDLLGASSTTWSVAHNFVHHTYTNIPSVDHDLDPGPWMKFSPQTSPQTALQKVLGTIFRFQFLYMWVLYGFTTLVWLIKKDFQQVFAPDPRTQKPAPTLDKVKVFAGKGLYAVVFIAIPLLVVDLPVWQIVVGMLVTQFASGFTLAITFQLAHCVEETAFPEPDAHRRIPQGWSAHQLRTTANFGGSNPVIAFFAGGLDHQVEHHLFPKTCHVHYPALSPLVRQTAREFGLPYLENPTLLGALRSHVRAMIRFGRPPAPATSTSDSRSEAHRASLEVAPAE